MPSMPPSLVTPDGTLMGWNSNLGDFTISIAQFGGDGRGIVRDGMTNAAGEGDARSRNNASRQICHLFSGRRAQDKGDLNGILEFEWWANRNEVLSPPEPNLETGIWKSEINKMSLCECIVG